MNHTIAPLFAFVRERHAIYTRRTAGKPKPWTDDPILQQYKFCNVYRELDTGTRWIAENWRAHDDPDLWFAMAVARIVNRPDTLDALWWPPLWWPVSWDADYFVRTLHARRDSKRPVWGSAYQVLPSGVSADKAEYFAHEVLTPMWRDREVIRPRRGDTLAAFHARLEPYPNIGTFMAAQIVADMKYVQPLRAATDWHTWAASGPGSRRGLNRVLGRDKKASWAEPQWFASLRTLHQQIQPLVARAGMPDLHAQDLQNCLCEFDKYERLRLGEGKTRCSYPGGG